jgi:hypothetical protein
MYCPFCKKNAAKLIKDNKVYCSLCDGLVEDNTPFAEKMPTLKCPKCEQYSTKEYCSVCGYKFIQGVDFS